MKKRILFAVEAVGALLACAGVAMINIPLSMIVSGIILVAACEANS